MAKFPNFGAIVSQLGAQTFIIMFVSIVVFALLGTSVAYAISPSDSIMMAFLKLGGTEKVSKLFVEAFFLSLAFYIVASFSAITITANKAYNSNIKIRKSSYFTIMVIPFVIFIFILFLKRQRPKSMSDEMVYGILAIAFVLASIGVMQLAQTALKTNEQEKDKEGKALTDILVTFLVAYLVLRLPLLFDTTGISGMEAIFYYSLTVLFAFIATLPTYLGVLLNHS